ncbi:exonuclease domain-containing protein [Streptomyces sp. LHD-70]|uniref:exonuclease domain-containing protein n=1 Tax=Streptomyces sp. LHD-70 TaxID=3072140 RepID=UPI00280E25CA|nr:exonuclease domain-containing protein [Streptomyces sp. LHD-70]MDQ8707585.1 exonuclease domain-containing protein [Streptomyces sp. LHD-70]
MKAGTAPAVADEDLAERGSPRGYLGGLPVYVWERAPRYLRTKTQLAGRRLKLAPGQDALAYLYIARYGTFPLYDPRDAVKMRPLSSRVKRRMTARRTCPQCSQVREHIMYGGQCAVCRGAAQRERARLEARTCWGCRAVGNRPRPAAHHRCGACRRAQLEQLRTRAAEWIERVTVCAEPGCTAGVVTKKEARAQQKAQRPGLWSRAVHWPLRCPPCTEVEAERAVERRAQREREAQDAAEARARQQLEAAARRQQEVERLQQWARSVLADDRTVILDTETTGLHSSARIVEISVITMRGEVLLDTLLDPGEPIPADATDIHGIGDQDVSAAPCFSAVFDQLAQVLNGRRVVIYNAPYDTGRLRHEAHIHFRQQKLTLTKGVHPLATSWIDSLDIEDAMIPYSDWFGDWHDYWGNYTWQPLDGGHRALDDCRTVITRLTEMAGRPQCPDEHAGRGALALAGAATT